jgi:hypothetical protein
MMNAGLNASTGSEEMGIGSDERVRKKCERFNGESFSN